jgi:hypothetical protein
MAIPLSAICWCGGPIGTRNHDGERTAQPVTIDGRICPILVCGPVLTLQAAVASARGGRSSE